MVSSTFNSVTYASRLKNAGMNANLADVQAEELQNIINNNLATKADLKMLELNLHKEMDEIKNDIKIMRYELQSFIIRSLITALGIIGTLQALFHFIK